LEGNYNADMYLTPDDLNQVENRIEEITKAIQEKIYFNDIPNLRTIEVGDNLNGKTLYFSFPRDAYKYITDDMTDITPMITTDTGDIICYQYRESLGWKFVAHKRNNVTSMLYDYDEADVNGNPYINRLRFDLDDETGVVTEINTDNELYNYIKIYDNDDTMPDYIKKEWVDNEIPYIQNIDNIEQGVKKIGQFYTKSNEWITDKDWRLYGKNYGTGYMSFSYIDINRWITNLNTIDIDEIDNVTIWNTKKTIYNWNEESD
jgi:hypothetical protein